jgi:hypothetical protein
MSDLPLEWTVLDRQLREGEPTKGWPGDPRLWLQLAYLEAPETGWYPQDNKIHRKGDIVARLLEVWRHTEEGRDVVIGRWQPSDLPQILSDLVAMDPGRPGHTDVLDRIDAANEAKEADLSRQYQDVQGEMMEHYLKLAHDLNNPRNVFRGMPGTRDDADLKR